MSQLPFGFSGPPDPDDEGSGRSRGSGEGSGAAGFGGIPGFGIPGLPGGGGAGGAGFDVGALGQMLSQLGQMLSHAGTSSGPVNYDLAKQMAMSKLGSLPAPDANAQSTAAEAVRMAEVWLDDACALPAGANTVQVWSAKDWVERTLPTWQRLCDPVATRFAGAWTEALPAEAREAAGPLLAMVSQMGGLAFGSQLGGALAQLGAEVLTSSDIGLPLAPAGTAALLPAAIRTFTAGLDLPAGEVLVYLAAREAAHQRLFAHVPWLRGRLLAAVEEFARGITVDTSGLEELARTMDPANPAALQEALGSGVLEPKVTPEQAVALVRLETLLALVEGWVDVVVSEAVGNRLPGAAALRETLRRRRASGGPAEQTFATLVGLHLRPRQLRHASAMWQLLGEKRGTAGRDALWAHPDLLPDGDDLENPTDFVADAQDRNDAIAELERSLAADAATKNDFAADAATKNDFAADAATKNDLAADAATKNDLAADAATKDAPDPDPPGTPDDRHGEGDEKGRDAGS